VAQGSECLEHSGSRGGQKYPSLSKASKQNFAQTKFSIAATECKRFFYLTSKASKGMQYGRVYESTTFFFWNMSVVDRCCEPMHGPKVLYVGPVDWVQVEEKVRMGGDSCYG